MQMGELNDFSHVKYSVCQSFRNNKLNTSLVFGNVKGPSLAQSCWLVSEEYGTLLSSGLGKKQKYLKDPLDIWSYQWLTLCLNMALLLRTHIVTEHC